MPNYRRLFVPGGCYFFTLVVHRRRDLFSSDTAVKILGSVFRRCVIQWPMVVNAIVLLPNHLHTIWTLPPGDDKYPKRWGWVKMEFTKQWLRIGGRDYAVSSGRKLKRQRGLWQPRYWEHAIEDEIDFERHFDYVHFNPVKYGYVLRPEDWPFSSFHRYLRQGVYEPGWGSTTPLDFSRIAHTVGE